MGMQSSRSGRSTVGTFVLWAVLAGCSGSSDPPVGLASGREAGTAASEAAAALVDLVRTAGESEVRLVDLPRHSALPMGDLPLGGVLVSASGRPLPGVVAKKELLPAGGQEHVVEQASRRLRVRVAQSDGTFLRFDPRLAHQATLEDGVWKPLGESLRVAIAPAAPVRYPLGSFHDFGDGGGPSPRWHETGDDTIWEVSVPRGDFVLTAESLFRPAAQMRITMPPGTDFMERVLQLPDACEPGLLVVEARDPSGGLAIPEFALRLVRELGPDLPLPGSFARSEEREGCGLQESFLLAPGHYSVTVEPRGFADLTAAQPAGVTRSFTLVPGGLAQLAMEFEVRSCVRLYSRGRPNNEPLRFVDIKSGEVVHEHHYGEAQGDEFLGFPEIFLPPGSYRLEGRIGARRYDLELELAPGRALVGGWFHNTETGWRLAEIQVEYRH